LYLWSKHKELVITIIPKGLKNKAQESKNFLATKRGSKPLIYNDFNWLQPFAIIKIIIPNKKIKINFKPKGKSQSSKPTN